LPNVAVIGERADTELFYVKPKNCNFLQSFSVLGVKTIIV